MQIRIADSLTKVLRVAEDGERPLQEGPLRLRACRNERESAQVVVWAEGRPLEGVTVTASDLVSEQTGHVIPSEQVLVNPVGYVETRTPAYPVERIGLWPDPLLPAGPADVPAGCRQPFWVTLHVPREAEAGSYRGAVTVQAEGEEARIPLELRVWDFALAPTPPLASSYAISDHALRQFYGYESVPEQVLRNYWDLLFTHRLSSDHIGSPLRQGIQAVIDGQEGPPFDFRAYDERLEYCFARGLTTVTIATLPGFQDEGPDLTEEQQQRLVVYLGEFARHLEARGWLERAQVLVWDEPRTRWWPQVLKELQVIHRAHPKLRSRLDGPVVGELIDHCEDEVDAAVLHMKSVGEAGSAAQTQIDRWRAAGKQLSMYVACDVHHPYPNVFIDYPLLDCRVLPWVNWRYDLQGLLYWSATYWGEANLQGGPGSPRWPQRPWVCANFVERWEGHRQEYNGDGHLIYPGPDGTALSSLRLEALRDGVEDHEYLHLLAQGLAHLHATRKEPALVAEAHAWLSAQPVIRTYTDWCQDPDVLLSAREELGELVERVTRAALT